MTCGTTIRMSTRSLRAAVVSTDARFRDQLKDQLTGDFSIPLRLEISERFVECNDQHLKALKQLGPDIVFIDFQDDPELAVKFTQTLADAIPGQRFIAVGPDISPQLLLSAMRAGVADYIHKPVASSALRESIARVAHLTGRQEARERQPGVIYAFFSPKGGAGATTVATNLAVLLAKQPGKKTLLVDLDLELGETALMLGMRPRFNFVDLVQNFHRMDADLLASFIERHESGVDLLSAPYHPEKAEVVTGEQIRRILLFLRQHYDYVVVDTSKSFSQSTLVAFEQADLVFLVTTADLPSLRNIQRGLPLLRRVVVRGDEQLRLVVNRYDPGDQISPADIERTLGLKVFWKLSNDYEAVIGSLNSGQPIVLNGTSSYGKDVKAMAASLLGTKEDGRRGGLTGTLRGALGRLSGGTRKGGGTSG